MGMDVYETTGVLYVPDPGHEVVDEFGSSGTFKGELKTPPALGSFAPVAVGVDQSNGDVYVVDWAHRVVDEFSSSGGYLAQIAETPAGVLPEPVDVAVSPISHEVYISVERAVDIFSVGLFSPTVLTGEAESFGTGATLNGSVNPEGVEVTSCQFEYGTTISYGQPPARCSEPSAAEVGKETSFVKVKAKLIGLTPNQTYHYRLVAANASFTERGKDGEFTIKALPTVNDQPPSASVITRTTARLSGTVNPENSPTTYHFEYGTTTAYGSKTGGTSAGAGYGDVPVGPQVLVELQPETTYHYRLVATNEAAGTETGPDYTFTTAPRTPPLVDTGGASGVTQTGATVSGTVGPEGYPTTYMMEIGTTSAYGTQISGSAGSGTEPVTVSITLQSLVAGTTYQYRLVATNVDGMSEGADQSFTTSSYTGSGTTPLILTLPLTPAFVPTPVFPAVKTTTTTKPKALTKAQKLAKALKACKKDKSKKKLRACEARARKKYDSSKTNQYHSR